MKEVSFEEALERLEEIVERLEDEALSLEETMALYQQGVKYASVCNKLLDEAERKIELLTEDEEGNFDVVPFDLPGEGA